MVATQAPGSQVNGTLVLAVPGFLVYELDAIGLTGFLARMPSELIVLEREHLDCAGTCVHCGRSWPCVYVTCAGHARQALGWPPSGHVQQAVRHG